MEIQTLFVIVVFCDHKFLRACLKAHTLMGYVKRPYGAPTIWSPPACPSRLPRPIPVPSSHSQGTHPHRLPFPMPKVLTLLRKGLQSQGTSVACPKKEDLLTTDSAFFLIWRPQATCAIYSQSDATRKAARAATQGSLSASEERHREEGKEGEQRRGGGVSDTLLEAKKEGSSKCTLEALFRSEAS